MSVTSRSGRIDRRRAKQDANAKKAKGERAPAARKPKTSSPKPRPTATRKPRRASTGEREPARRIRLSPKGKDAATRAPRRRDGALATRPPGGGGGPRHGRRPTSRRHSYLRRYVLAPLTLGAVAAATLAISASPVFAARHVRVGGTSHLTSAEVLRTAGVDGSTNVIWLPTDVIERRLEADPWIAEATVTRSLPSTVRISVVERHPASALRVGDTWVVVASDGTLLETTRHDPGLPTLPAAPRAALGARLQELAVPAAVAGRMSPWLRNRVRSVLPEGREVVLELGSGARVLFGSLAAAEEKEQALAAILRWAAQNGRRVEQVDVRAPLAPAARLAPRPKR